VLFRGPRFDKIGLPRGRRAGHRPYQGVRMAAITSKDGGRINAVLAPAGYIFGLLERWLEALLRVLFLSKTPTQCDGAIAFPRKVDEHIGFAEARWPFDAVRSLKRSGSSAQPLADQSEYSRGKARP
jgi:hypothetical protein